MTPQSSRRLTVATACLQAHVIGCHVGNVGGWSVDGHVCAAIELADKLLAAIDASEPISPADTYKECVHLWDNFSYGSVCQKCGAVSP